MTNATKPSPGIAAVLSFFIPGLGQMYCAKVGRGFAFMAGTITGYFLLVVPGLAMHLWAILDAKKVAENS